MANVPDGGPLMVSSNVLDVPNGKLQQQHTEIENNTGFPFATSCTSLYSNTLSHGTFGSFSSSSLAMFEADYGSTEVLLNTSSVERLKDGGSVQGEPANYGSQERSRQSSGQSNLSKEWNDTGSFLNESVDDTVVLSGADPFSSDFPQSTVYATSDTENYFSDFREKRYRANTFTERKSFFQGRASTPLIAWNVINMVTGLSMLALPYAVSRGGIVTVALVPLIGLLTFYTGRIVVDCTYVHGTSRQNTKRLVRVRADYIELGQDSYNGRLGGFIVSIFEVLEMLSTCCLNVNILGALFNEILPALDIRLCTIIGGAVALPTFFVRKLSIIGWMQTISIVTLGIGMILVEGYCMSSYKEWSFKKIPLYDLKSLPVASGIILYAFSVHHVLPGIEQQMRKPKQFGRMLFSANLVSSLIFCFFGVTNALVYGAKTDQVITVDLRNHFGLGIASAFFIFVSVLCTFALPSFVVMDRLDRTLSGFFPSFTSSQDSTSLWISILVRSLVVVLSVIVAVFLPCFGLLMAFFGSVLGSTVCLILPCWFHLKLKRDSLGVLHYILDLFVILAGLFFVCSGAYFSCEAMLQCFNRSGRKF